MSVTEQYASFAVPGVIQFFTGAGGFPHVRIDNAAASAVISLYGGQLLSFVPIGGRNDLLFLSHRASYTEGKPIKGGVPVCWPWFGSDPNQPDRPAHGFARTSLWSVTSTGLLSDAHTRITLSLDGSQVNRHDWPHAFLLTLTIDISDALGLTLTTHNPGTQAFPVTQALHTYFRIGDIAQTWIEGLDDRQYLDKVRGYVDTRQEGVVRFAGEVDRIYQDAAPTHWIVDLELGRTIDIDSEHSRTTVVWNPGEDVAASMDDLENDAYRYFVCVETANAADDVVQVGPGESTQLVAHYRIDELAS